ncbi:MAG: EamA family transporter [Lachnospiraceae bacterium]|nr:EamA family transporter [Lachnospiraceae bacterium]
MNASSDNFIISASMVIASAVLWGLYGTFVTVLSSMGLSGNALVFLRMFATCVPVGILIGATDRSAFRVRPSDVPLFIANGLLSLLFFTSCYTAAIKVTKIATAAALLYTAPAIVMVLSAILFGERMTARKVLCCLLAVVGCAFASGIGGELFAGAGAASGTVAAGSTAAGTAAAGSTAAGTAATGTATAGASAGLITPVGLLLGLGAGLGYALYSIFSRIILNRGYSVYTNVFYSFGVAMIGFFVLACLDGSIGQVFENPARTALALLCGLLTGSLAYVLYTTGMKGMETSRAAQLTTIEPVTAALLGSFLFHQPLSGWEIAGIVMVVASVVLMNTGD